jgi:hypothetical protein
MTVIAGIALASLSRSMRSMAASLSGITGALGWRQVMEATAVHQEVGRAGGQRQFRDVGAGERRPLMPRAGLGQRRDREVHAKPPPAALCQVADLGSQPAPEIHRDAWLPSHQGRLGGEQFRRGL